ERLLAVHQTCPGLLPELLHHLRGHLSHRLSPCAFSVMRPPRSWVRRPITVKLEGAENTWGATAWFQEGRPGYVRTRRGPARRPYSAALPSPVASDAGASLGTAAVVGAARCSTTGPRRSP